MYRFFGTFLKSFYLYKPLYQVSRSQIGRILKCLAFLSKNPVTTGLRSIYRGVYKMSCFGQINFLVTITEKYFFIQICDFPSISNYIFRFGLFISFLRKQSGSMFCSRINYIYNYGNSRLDHLFQKSLCYNHYEQNYKSLNVICMISISRKKQKSKRRK